MQVLPQTHSYKWIGHKHTECATVFSLHIHTHIVKSGFVTDTAPLQALGCMQTVGQSLLHVWTCNVRADAQHQCNTYWPLNP